MKVTSKNVFITVRTEGAILPADLLQRIADGDKDLDGLKPFSYHLLEGEKLNEAVNRSWTRLRGAWVSLKAALEKLPAADPGTSVTRDRWLLPLLQELGYGRLAAAKALEVGDKNYPISHGYQHTPIHLVGWRVELDQRTAGVAGAARSSPHSLVQELLNRSDEHLWAFVSNGRQWRILRDNASLTRQAYVEFDLEAIMAGEVYADFVLLWLLCHQSRVEAEKPEQCWLEKWSKTAQEQGTRALDQLRNGVERAIAILGRGFLSHSANRDLRRKLQSGELGAQEYHHQLRRLVYRLLFLFVVEDREVLFDPDSSSMAKERYVQFYSTVRLRNLATTHRGTRHADLFHSLRVVMQQLGYRGCPELGLAPLGGALWSDRAIPELEPCQISNGDLLDAVRALAFIHDRYGLRYVDYKNLRSRELGSIYESLLELHPEINVAAGIFELKTAAGNRRKTMGCYYTPESLVKCLLDSALDPVLEEACRQSDPESAILNLKVCDTACGSGHFLTAAAHRIAKRLATIRTGDEEPTPEATRTALRQVIGRCIYGVDVNEMAVEICKFALWMEAMEPGKPLPFLDHHIQHGDSLLGTVPALMGKGIPDEAFNPIEGDDKTVCSKYKKQNKKEREKQQLTLLAPDTQPWAWLDDTLLYDSSLQPWEQLADISDDLTRLEQMSDDSIADVQRKQQEYERIINSTAYKFSRLRADVWCAAFMWKKTQEFPYCITQVTYRQVMQNPLNTPDWMEQEVYHLRHHYHFFHWHVAFANVFRVPQHKEDLENKQAGWSGGFDVEVGNTPWERVKIQEREWFAAYRLDIADAPNTSARQRLIKELVTEDPALYRAYLEACRKAEGESHLIRNTGRYPLCGRGDVNTYAVFAETNRWLINSHGRVGCIVPSGIATDDTTKFFFQDLIKQGSLISLLDFQSGTGLFGEIGHSRFKFCLLTLTGSGKPNQKKINFAFFLRDVLHLREQERFFSLTTEEIFLLNPNTGNCPIFRSQKDAEITKNIYRNLEILFKEGVARNNPWNITFQRMLDMSVDSSLFLSEQELKVQGYELKGNIFEHNSTKFLPLYEAKMLHHFNHRFGDYRDKLENSESTALPDVSSVKLANPN